MSAAPQLNSTLTSLSAPAWPLSQGPSHPAATILRFPRPRMLIAVEPDPRDGIGQVVKTTMPSDVTAGWFVVLALAVVGFVLF